MTTLTVEDIRNIFVLINRSQMTGHEAEGVVVIKQKLSTMIQELDKPVENKDVS